LYINGVEFVVICYTKLIFCNLWKFFITALGEINICMFNHDVHIYVKFESTFLFSILREGLDKTDVVECLFDACLCMWNSFLY